MPASQAELDACSARLGVSKDWIVSTAILLGASVDRVYNDLLEPFHPYLQFTGALQPWALFIAPNRWPTRFEIETHSLGHPDSLWQPVFREGSSEFAWNRQLLDHEHARSHFELASCPRFGWVGNSTCRWAAKELFRERTEVGRVRCRNYRAQTPSPEQAARGETNPGEWLFVDKNHR